MFVALPAPLLEPSWAGAELGAGGAKQVRPMAALRGPCVAAVRGVSAAARVQLALARVRAREAAALRLSGPEGPPALSCFVVHANARLQPARAGEP